MSFSKARRFNEIQGCSPAPGAYHPRFITDLSMSYGKSRSSYGRGSLSCSSMNSSAGSSSPFCYKQTREPRVFVFNSTDTDSSRTDTSCSTLRMKSRIPTMVREPKKQAVSPKRSLSRPRTYQKSPTRQGRWNKQGHSLLEEKVAVEMISNANAEERDSWIETIQNLQNTVYSMQSRFSKLEEEVQEERENNRILKLQNATLENMVDQLQCRIVSLDEYCHETENNDKIKQLVETIDNLQISEMRLRENFEKIEKENKIIATDLTHFVTQILDLLKERNDWGEKESEYINAISSLDDIICESQTLLFETEERLMNLVQEFENFNELFVEKVKSSEALEQSLNCRQLDQEEKIDRLEKKIEAADESFDQLNNLWNNSEKDYKERIVGLQNKILDLEYAFTLFIFILRKHNVI